MLQLRVIHMYNEIYQYSLLYWICICEDYKYLVSSFFFQTLCLHIAWTVFFEIREIRVVTLYHVSIRWQFWVCLLNGLAFSLRCVMVESTGNVEWNVTPRKIKHEICSFDLITTTPRWSKIMGNVWCNIY